MSSDRRHAPYASNEQHKRPRTQRAAAAAAQRVETDETGISSDDDGERERYRPRPRISKSTANESDFEIMIDEPPSHSTEAAAAAATRSSTTPSHTQLHHLSQLRPNVEANQHQQAIITMGQQHQIQQQLTTIRERVPIRANTRPGRYVKIDRDSMTIVFDFLTLDELATKAHRLNKEWMMVLLHYYQPAQDHPIRRAMRTPTPEDILEPMNASLPTECCTLSEENMVGLAKAPLVYRRLVHSLALATSEERGSVRYPVSYQLMNLISNAELFPSLRRLYCRLDGYPSARAELLIWSLPPRLHTLDCVIEARRSTRFVPEPNPIVQDLFLRIGEVTSIRRLSIQFRLASIDHSLTSDQMSALSRNKDLLELRLVGPGGADIPRLSLPPLLSEFIHLRCLSAYGPTDVRSLAEAGVPIQQLRYLPVPHETSRENLQLLRTGMQIDETCRSYLTQMKELREFIGLFPKNSSPSLLMCVPTLTRLDLNILDPLTSKMTESLAHCRLIRTLRLQCHFTSSKTVEANAALGMMVGCMKEIESIELVVRRGLSGRSVSELYAPHLAQTLKTLRFGSYEIPIDTQPVNISDLKHLVSLTSLAIVSWDIEPRGRELTEVFDSLVSLTHAEFSSRVYQIDHVLNGPFASLMESNVAGQLRHIEPPTLLMDILPPRYNQMSQLVSLKSLVIRHLEGDASFISDMHGLTSLLIGLCDSDILQAPLVDDDSKWNEIFIRHYEDDSKMKIKKNNSESSLNILVDSQLLMNEISQLCWLRELGLSELPDFNSRHLIHVISALPHLSKLSLILLPTLVDINILTERRQTLRELTLKHLTSLAPTMVISKLIRLRRLVVVGCPALPKKSLRSLPVGVMASIS